MSTTLPLTVIQDNLRRFTRQLETTLRTDRNLHIGVAAETWITEHQQDILDAEHPDFDSVRDLLQQVIRINDLCRTLAQLAPRPTTTRRNPAHNGRVTLRKPR